MSDHVLQVRATAALLMILTTESLPDCQWTVYRGLGLEGGILGTGDDGLYDLQIWAQKLGTGVRTDPSTGDRYIAGTYSHIPVRVFVHE